ncbi:MAG: A/G-specific adenine glycosylase [Parcubacteria group bacterium Greene0714_7]|nr:MAG: A/G-specific adenine glycosylase [Parcubacteria group bacterium Greene0714_7]
MPASVETKSFRAFQRDVYSFFKSKGRHALPWRKTKNPYRILVSEIMLQQTQVDRVIPKYRLFLKKFKTVQVLAEASLGEVLREWQGLGYNRRAKMLHEAAKVIVTNYGGEVPTLYSELVSLPGIGDYTAKAVRVFAWNEPEVLIETNIRSVFIHHFFSKRHDVSDKKLFPYMEIMLDIKNSREWYWALMDYGSYLKKTIPNPSRKSAHHTKQKSFKGSNREVRGAVLRALVSRSKSLPALLKELNFSEERIEKQITALRKEGLVVIRKNKVQLP